MAHCAVVQHNAVACNVSAMHVVDPAWRNGYGANLTANIEVSQPFVFSKAVGRYSRPGFAYRLSKAFHFR